MEPITNIPESHEYRILRNVTFADGYRLMMWQAGVWRHGQQGIGYALWLPGETEPLFAGEDYFCGAFCPPDSDEALRGILGFLTVQPGDVEDEYFDGYTTKQREWAESGECERLSGDICIDPMAEGDDCPVCGKRLTTAQSGEYQGRVVCEACNRPFDQQGYFADIDPRD